jgi:RNA polymerase sigma-70 factor (ECF subfamily)
MAISDEQRRALNAAMDKYADGNDAAFGDVYDLLGPSLLRYFISKTRDQSRSEDLVQQTLMQLHVARRNYKRGTDVMPWAFAIGRNVMTDAFRKTRKEVLPLDADDFEATINRAMERESIPDDLAVTKQTIAKMREVYDELPESQRTPYELINGQDLSVSECAQVLGITDNAVKLRIHRVYEALRGILKS